TVREEHHPVESHALVAKIIVDFAGTPESKLSVALLVAAKISEAFDFDVGALILSCELLKRSIQLRRFFGLQGIAPRIEEKRGFAHLRVVELALFDGRNTAIMLIGFGFQGPDPTVMSRN